MSADPLAVMAASEGGCSELEPYALQVTDASMEPEFPENCVIVIEPALGAPDGTYVVADYADDTWFRQFVIDENGDKFLVATGDGFADMQLIGPYQIRGVIIAQNYRGKRKKYI